MHLQTRGEHQDGLHAVLQPPTEQGEKMSAEFNVVFFDGIYTLFWLTWIAMDDLPFSIVGVFLRSGIVNLCIMFHRFVLGDCIRSRILF